MTAPMFWQRTGGSMTGQTRAYCAAVMTGLALLTTGCSGISINVEPHVQDPVNKLWYLESDVTQDPEPIETKLTMLEARDGISVHGSFGSPRSIPGPDDYWWQAVVIVSPEQVTQLAETALDDAEMNNRDVGEVHSGPDVSTGSLPPGSRVDDGVLRDALVEPLESMAGECAEGWVLLGRTLNPRENFGDAYTDDGDLITLAAVCEGSDRVVVTSSDM